MSKICTKCKENKDLVEFSKRKDSKDGYRSSCTKCTSKQKKGYAHKNIDKVKDYQKKYRKDNAAHIDNQRKQYVLNNTVKIAEQRKEHYDTNRETILQDKKEYYILNKDLFAEKNKNYRKNNRDGLIAYGVKYREDNKEMLAKKEYEYRVKNRAENAKRSRAYAKTTMGKLVRVNTTNKRRGLKKSTSDGTLTTLDVKSPLTEELHTLLETQDYKCVYCDCDISNGTNPRHLDHIQPLSKGGKHSIDNVQWLCASCNLSKSDKIIPTPIEVGKAC